MRDRFGQRETLDRYFTSPQPKRRGDGVPLRSRVVKGEQFRSRVARLRPTFLQQVDDIAVQLLAPAFQKRVIGGVLNQSMRERVHRVGYFPVAGRESGRDQVSQTIA